MTTGHNHSLYVVHEGGQGKETPGNMKQVLLQRQSAIKGFWDSRNQRESQSMGR